MNKKDLELIREAILSSRTELDTIADNYEDYAPTGNLLDQLDESLHIIEGYINNAAN